MILGSINMENFEKEIMDIINAISNHIYMYGEKESIDKYYQEHGTYKGIIDYLSKIKMERENE